MRLTLPAKNLTLAFKYLSVMTNITCQYFHARLICNGEQVSLQFEMFTDARE